ncbi:MAG: TetR/AcrR family transcriptional regulator [Henriciella sp.]|nr:TetR/AcrR family transcriptional regulator [Henriciella sp.]
MTKAPAKRRQGPRRSEDSRAAILEATRKELVENGWRKLSVDKISRHAKASKQTIYRWWPAIGTMCVEAALTQLPPRSTHGRDPVERIADLLQPLESAMKAGSGHAVFRGALMAACDDKEAGDAWRNWIKDNIRAPLRLVLAEIATKKIIRRDFDLDEAVDTLTGPIWSRVLIFRAPLPDNFSSHQASKLLKSLAP